MATQYDPATGLPVQRKKTPTIAEALGLGSLSGTAAGGTLSTVGGLLNGVPAAAAPFNPSFHFDSPSFEPFSVSQALLTPYAGYSAATIPGAPAPKPAPNGAKTLKLSDAYTPDFASLLSGDPTLLQFNRDLAAQDAADRAALARARQQAVATFGEAPAGLDFGGDITPEALALAKANTDSGLSTEARLQRQHEDNVRSILNNLAARGGLSSGELGYQLGRESTDYAGAQYDSRQKLLEYVSGAAAAYADAQRQRAAQKVQATQNASNFLGTLPQNQAKPARLAYWDETSGLYFEPETGDYYREDGTPAPPPAPAVPAIPTPPPAPNPSAGWTPTTPLPPAPQLSSSQRAYATYTSSPTYARNRIARRGGV